MIKLAPQAKPRRLDLKGAWTDSRISHLPSILVPDGDQQPT